MVALVLAFAGWIALSLIATPIIGRFLVDTAQEAEQPREQTSKPMASPEITSARFTFQNSTTDRRVHRFRQVVR